MARIKIDKIRINDTYKKMYQVEDNGNYYEYLNVKFISNFEKGYFCHFVYGDNENEHSYLLPNVRNLFTSKKDALKMVRSNLIKRLEETQELINLELKNNG